MQNELIIKVNEEGIYRKLTLNGKVYEDKTISENAMCHTTINAISIQLENDGIDLDVIEDETGVHFGLSDDLTDLREVLISM